MSDGRERENEIRVCEIKYEREKKNGRVKDRVRKERKIKIVNEVGEKN